MTQRLWLSFSLIPGLVLGLAMGCRRDRVPVEELYATRMLGLSYLQRNQLAEAEVEFRKLTDFAPDDPLGYADLGLTYLQAARYEDAERQLLRARELDPEGVDVRLALARLYALTQRTSEARAELERLRRDTTASPRVLYALAELEAQQGGSASARSQSLLRGALARSPGNLAVRLQLAASFATGGMADSAVRHLEEIRRLPPEPPPQARAALDSSIHLLRGGNTADARASVDRFVRLMEGTAPYQASLDEVRWIEGPIPGRVILNFAPRSFVTVHGVRDRATTGLATFVDATDEAGFVPSERDSGGVNALAAGDVDGDGVDELFLSGRLYRVQGGFVRDVTGSSNIALPREAAHAVFADYDNDGWLDLFVLGRDGTAQLLRNRGDGTFMDATAQARIADTRAARKAAFVDLDHDGDLDLLLVGDAARTVYRNNLDGTFTEATAGFGLAGEGASDVVFADFDGDGRVDLFFTAKRGSNALMHNGGAQRFSDVTAASGVTSTGDSGPAAVGDYDNDGFLDLFVGTTDGTEPALWRNSGNGTFARDRRSSGVLQGIRSTVAATAAFLDHDNDGWLDLLVAGRSGLHLLRNDGTGRMIDRSTIVPEPARVAGAQSLIATEVDDDGDEDVVLIDGRGAPRLLRNDLGNSNLALNVELKGLRTGSGKNNTFGIGARVEVRAGSIYQTRVVTGRVSHFGLGPHLKADVLRVEWPNGVPQTVYLPGTDQDVVERELLKGSCAFVYTWDGKRFRFVTDAMWRSALGMPLGLMGGTSAFAPAGASQEYVKISGDVLQPRDERYVLQLTEELWETAYADEVKLVAVDRPDSVEVFVDERFVPPGPVSLRLFQIARRVTPRSAVDERGQDVLPALRDADDVYVSGLTPMQYQGVVEPHHVILDLGPEAGRPDTYLFLRGWIYPTDASINVALSQQSTIALTPPSLEVRDANGNWRTVADIGFPSGKDKTIVIELSGKFPTADRRVRIRTNMQIYWDQAFVGRNLKDGQAKITTLAPTAADLHVRGFSRMYRKGGRYGPYWFDYDDVSKESPWRPIEGAFTRLGDVLPLLRAGDDMYAVMAPGDEVTIEFDATSASSLPRGWKRDFLLYTDGWIKDSDLNTAFGTTVDPLPFHAARAYPYAPGDAYPTDAEHQRYLREYNTRIVKR
jgi:Tfp pilus assembly protein PilF